MSPWLCHNSWFLSTIRKRGICPITRSISEQMAPRPTIANTSHHHQLLQAQACHFDHARNAIKSLRGGKLIISSGYEQTQEFGFWPCCLMRGHPSGAARLVSSHPRAWWHLGAMVQNDLAFIPQAPRCTCFRTGNSALHLLWPAPPCPDRWGRLPELIPRPSTSPSSGCPSGRLIQPHWASQDR